MIKLINHVKINEPLINPVARREDYRSVIETSLGLQVYL